MYNYVFFYIILQKHGKKTVNCQKTKVFLDTGYFIMIYCCNFFKGGEIIWKKELLLERMIKDFIIQ